MVDGPQDSGEENKLGEFREIVTKAFDIYDEEKLPDGVRFYVNPKSKEAVEGFKEELIHFLPHYHVEVNYKYGEMVLEIRRAKEEKERRWINIILLIATIFSTTFVGASFTPDFNILEGIKFSLAIIFVLGSHEMGHFLAARYWGMKTTLPYFIPFPTIVGTLGAVIKHKGPIPNRNALFDVGVSGPIVGVVASILITAIGLTLPYQPAEGGSYIELGTPPLFDAISSLIKPSVDFIHPIAFAGWVGMLVTFFNLLPVGQLDGGHVMRAMIGEKAEYVSKFMPLVLIIGGWIYSFLTRQESILIFWGIVALIFSLQRHPQPLNDKIPIDRKRIITGVFAFVIAILCFNPLPIKSLG
ncbi:site-2 protease family protein [Archaeoglobales archaeon]|nr:MAG: site-2 protease family protein [Archaeoglobales archaeon]